MRAFDASLVERDFDMKLLFQLINYGSAAFAFLAAALWFWSARVKTPRAFSVHGVVGGGLGGALGGPIGGGTVHPASSPDLADLGAALRRQSQLSAAAAVCAGLAAILGAIALIIAGSSA